jgi:putative restriction endonuclease
MAAEPLEARFEQLNVWRSGDKRAPHKPLLILLALGAWSRGERQLPFSECGPKLAELLREFGPASKSLHPEYPFWRLQNDGIWVVEAGRDLRSRASNSDPPKSELLAAGATGRFARDVESELRSRPDLVQRLAQRVLDAHFPETIHEDIRAAVGLQELEDARDRETSSRRRRDPNFRNAVLMAYGYRCAVCELDLRLDSITIGLEAAHVKWHQARGPDAVHNGVALCSLHHKLFDLGAFHIGADRRILVSEQVHGTSRFEEVLLRHHGALAAEPLRTEHRVLRDFVGWHFEQVFKREARPGA